MDIKEFIINLNRRATDNLFSCVEKMPEDKREWVPVPETRSALSQLREVALSPLWAIGIMKERKFEFKPEDFAAFKAEMEKLPTVEACKAACEENMVKLEAAIRAFPEADLAATIDMPFGGGMTMSFAEIMLIHNWNATYHFGQICYIQTCYGDKDMS